MCCGLVCCSLVGLRGTCAHIFKGGFVGTRAIAKWYMISRYIQNTFIFCIQWDFLILIWLLASQQWTSTGRDYRKAVLYDNILCGSTFVLILSDRRQSALLQLHFNYRLQTSLQWIGQIQLQDGPWNISLWAFQCFFKMSLNTCVNHNGCYATIYVFKVVNDGMSNDRYRMWHFIHQQRQ